MSPQNEFLNLLADEAEKNCNLDCKISLKELSAKNSLYAELGEGFVETQYYNKTAVRVFPVLCWSRHRDQQKCMENLCNINCRGFLLFTQNYLLSKDKGKIRVFGIPDKNLATISIKDYNNT